MVWQDIVLTIAYLIFTVALLPQVYEGFKFRKGVIAISTSVPTFIGLYVISYVFYTLDLTFSAVMSVVTGTLWLILFIQRLVYGGV